MATVVTVCMRPPHHGGAMGADHPRIAMTAVVTRVVAHGHVPVVYGKLLPMANIIMVMISHRM